MRRSIAGLIIAITVATWAPTAHASNVGFNFGLNIGNAPAPVYESPPVVIEEPPEFVAQPALGVYAAVGTPYDIFYAGNGYYLSRGNVWYAAPYYNGPWVQVGYRALPWGLRRYPITRIRYIRDGGCRHNDDEGDYEYRHFRPRYRQYKHWEEDDDD